MVTSVRCSRTNNNNVRLDSQRNERGDKKKTKACEGLMMRERRSEIHKIRLSFGSQTVVIIYLFFKKGPRQWANLHSLCSQTSGLKDSKHSCSHPLFTFFNR